MKIMNVEKRILNDLKMDQLLNLNANENLMIRDESDGKRCVGYVDLKGQYLLDDEVKDLFGNLFPVKSDDDFMRIYHYELLEDDNYNSYFDIGVNSLRIHRSI